MNAPGIPAFYGAFSRETCIAEVRPSVGSLVLTGEFEVLQRMNLLDLSAFHLPYPGSIFRSNAMEEAEAWNFLGELAAMMSQPVQPHEQDIR